MDKRDDQMMPQESVTVPANFPRKPRHRVAPISLFGLVFVVVTASLVVWAYRAFVTNSPDERTKRLAAFLLCDVEIWPTDGTPYEIYRSVGEQEQRFGRLTPLPKSLHDGHSLDRVPFNQNTVRMVNNRLVVFSRGNCALIVPQNDVQVHGWDTWLVGGKLTIRVETIQRNVPFLPSSGNQPAVPLPKSRPNQKVTAGSVSVERRGFDVIVLTPDIRFESLVAALDDVNRENPYVEENPYMNFPVIPSVPGGGFTLMSIGPTSMPIRFWKWDQYLDPRQWARYNRTVSSGGYKHDSLLHLAIHTGRIEWVRTLVEKGADVNRRGAWNMTPLHEAARLGQPEMVRLLLAKGADTTARDGIGSKTPREWVLWEIAKFAAAQSSVRAKAKAIGASAKPLFRGSTLTEEMAADGLLTERLILLKRVLALLRARAPI